MPPHASVTYIEPVFRPPSEAQSLILPVTNGCSWNRCTFCEMYTQPQKAFRALPEADTLASIARCGSAYGDRVRRIFLADGDALVLPTRRLLAILAAIREHLPAVHRISAYCLPRNLRKKADSELAELRAAGLELVYVGAESGNETVLARVNKGESFASTADALLRLGQAGIRRSVMILTGLGGQGLSDAHADDSARLINATQPEFLSTLVVSFPAGEDRLRADFPDWRPLELLGLLREQRRFVAGLDLQRTIFRSDHASNWLVLKGTLGADKTRLLAQLDAAIASPSSAPLRPAWARGL